VITCCVDSGVERCKNDIVWFFLIKNAKCVGVLCRKKPNWEVATQTAVVQFDKWLIFTTTARIIEHGRKTS
jgi:hypothetical protein